MSARLTFALLRAANLARLPTFKNAKGKLAHPPVEGQPPGHDWALSQWSNALGGEFGETADLIKKIERGDFDLDEVVTIKGETMTAREFLAKEIADQACYLDLLANRAGIDLGEAVKNKFNEISNRVDSPIFIELAGGDYRVVDRRYVKPDPVGTEGDGYEAMLPDNNQAVESHLRHVSAMSDPERDR